MAKLRTTRLMIIDKNPLELVGLKSLFTDDGMRIHAESSISALKLDEKITGWRPDVILFDFHSYEDQIDALTARIKRLGPELKVLWLTLDDDPQIRYDAISCQADGCVQKANFEEILQAVETVQNGDVFYPRWLLAKFAYESCLVLNHLGRKVSRLTDREKQVLQLIREGATNEEIAGELHISVETVKAHIRSIRKTLGVTNRRQMICCLRPIKRDEPKSDRAGKHLVEV